MTKEAKKAADAIKKYTKEQEGYSEFNEKQAKLRMEKFGDDKDDPVLKRAVNFIERLQTGKSMLLNFLVDAHQKKDIKEARKIASEIIRNIDPNKSVKSQIESLGNFGGIRGTVKKRLKKKSTYSRGGLTRTGHTDHRAKGLFK
tara:strand:- start:49 stop:480 length:432 start_codon:yes stop_codon:yes gene_type:complete